MIIVFKPKTKDNDLNRVIEKVENLGLKTHISKGEETTIVGLIGDTTKVDARMIEVDEAVEKVMHV